MIAEKVPNVILDRFVLLVVAQYSWGQSRGSPIPMPRSSKIPKLSNSRREFILNVLGLGLKGSAVLDCEPKPAKPYALSPISFPSPHSEPKRPNTSGSDP